MTRIKKNEIKLVVIIPFYNEFKALQLLLLSLSSIGLPAILCDGRFTNFQKIKNSDLSTDGSRFLVTAFKNAKLISLGACKVEQKLNRLFKEASKGGYTHVILLGCDENISGNLNLFTKKLIEKTRPKPQLFLVRFIEYSKGKTKKRPNIARIFHLPSLIRAQGSHNQFFSIEKPVKDNIRPLKANPSIINGLVIHHDNSIRNQERNELMKNYQDKLSKTQAWRICKFKKVF